MPGFNVEGWQVAPQEVRQIATKMGVSETLLLPEVIVVGEDADDKLKSCPLLHSAFKRESPSGYFITIPESMVKEASKTRYVLGYRARGDIGHELGHYLEHLELGTKTGREDDPYNAAAKEIRADLRAGIKNLSRALAFIIRTLVRNYGLTVEEASQVVDRVARDLGVNERIISRAKRRYRHQVLGEELR